MKIISMRRFISPKVAANLEMPLVNNWQPDILGKMGRDDLFGKKLLALEIYLKYKMGLKLVAT